MAKKTEKATETKIPTFADAVEAARKAARVTVGSYVKAYELARETAEKSVADVKARAEKLLAQGDDLVKELEEKGAEVEALAEKNIADTRSNVLAFAEPRLEKIRALVPGFGVEADSETKVAELEAEIAELSKKLESLKKAPAAKAEPKKAAAKPAVKKAPVAKAAPKKPAAKPAAPKTEAEAPAAKTAA